MDVPFLNLSRHYRAMEREIGDAATRVLASGRYVLGEEVESFEKEFAVYCGVRHAVGVASGTDAIHLALSAAGIRRGDGVVTAPNTAFPTVCAILAAGARPVFVDVDPSTLTLCPERLGELLATKRESLGIRAIVPVHLYGHPANLARIMELARRYDLVVIEDAAQAHGASYDGRRVGGFGTAGCFSFYPTKNLGAFGDGGMVVTDDDDVAARVRSLRNYGEVSKYRNREFGINSRLDELQAAILREKLKRLDRWVETRRSLAAIYDRELRGAEAIPPIEVSPARHCYHLYVVRSRDRDALRARLADHGIGSQVHYPLLVTEQEAFRGSETVEEEFPVAKQATREILSLPLQPELGVDEIRAVALAVRGGA